MLKYTEMKTITLMTLKNEEWIIDTTFPILEKISDEIIVANNNSSDKSVDLLNNYKVEIINSDSTTPSNTVRWKLLDQARKRHGNNNLIMCIDADEFVPPGLFFKSKKNILSNIPGTVFSSPWVQVWRSVTNYRNDNSVWNPKVNSKPFMFLDNGNIDYKRNAMIIDHTSRVPEVNTVSVKKVNFPLIHLQFVNWERSQIKQLWYQCIELINGADPNEINNKYKVASDEKNIKYKKLNKKWVKDVFLDPKIEKSNILDIWYVEEINKMINKFGIEKFHILDIWEHEFVKKIIVNN